jgi:choline dehydrogenase-like flavoprotein
MNATATDIGVRAYQPRSREQKHSAGNFMYLDDENLVAAASTKWDVIVVGAGAVGLVLSVSLARANKRVLLLESGTADPGYARDLNEIRVTGRQHLGAIHGRARAIGGTTTLWGGQLTRFVPYDFDAREIMPDCNWPVHYEDIEKYYAEVAALLGLDVSHAGDESVLNAIGGNAVEDRSGCEIFFTRWLREPNLARQFADDLTNLATLTIAPRCHGTEIICRSDNPEIIEGMRVVFGDGKKTDFHAHDVVLACGTIEISRLLLLTAKKSPALQWAQNPNIGRYFQDHLDLVIGKIELKNKKAFADIFENAVLNGYKYQPKIRMRTPVLRRLGCLNIACTVRFDSSIAEDVHMLKQFFKSFGTGARIDKPLQTLRRMVALTHVWFPLVWRYLRHRRVLAIADRGISVIAHCEQRPLKHSQITLDSTATDRFGDPIARLHWVVDESFQIKSLQSFADELKGFLKSECDADVLILPGILAGDQAVLAGAQDSYHQCGGSRMSSNSTDGVVDSNCRVFGTKNLYVAGAAVFPTSSFANPTFTAMALACRLGSHLMDKRPG